MVRCWAGHPGSENRAAQILSLVCRDPQYEPRIREALRRYLHTIRKYPPAAHSSRPAGGWSVLDSVNAYLFPPGNSNSLFELVVDAALGQRRFERFNPLVRDFRFAQAKSH